MISKKIKKEKGFISNQFSSVTQWCPTLFDPLDGSMSVFPVHHQLPELTQTHEIVYLLVELQRLKQTVYTHCW